MRHLFKGDSVWRLIRVIWASFPWDLSKGHHLWYGPMIWKKGELVKGRYICASCSSFIILFYRHYQGELFQYYTIGRKQTWSTVEDLVHFSNKTPIPWKALTHFNYSIHQYSRDQKLQMMLSQFPGSKFKSRLEMGAAEETPPVTIYTYFTLETYLCWFWVLMVIQTCVIIAVKRLANPGPFHRQNWVQRFINGLENCMIPVPMEDWDDHHGTINFYIEAQKKVKSEMKWTFLVNLLMNIIMCIPMIILGRSLS